MHGKSVMIIPDNVARGGASQQKTNTDDTSSTLMTKIPNGLKNLGNTCYLNAQLQCAYHIPLVRSLILSPPPPAPSQLLLDEERNDDDVIEEHSVALTALQHVFASLNSPLGKAGTTNVLCKNMDIDVWEQQDTQEFWKLLLPKIKLKQLQDLYQGHFEDYIIAQDDSNRERRREELFLDLSLDVSSGSVLSSLTSMFTESELLKVEEGNGWKPSDDSEKVDARKGSLLRVDGLPNILQLHLMRFQYDWETEVMSKIKSRFAFSDLLDLSEICNDVTSIKDNFQTIYDLQSIIIHRGEFGSGHYYSYVRPNIKAHQWFRINDEIVTPVSFQEVIKDAFGGDTITNDTNANYTKRKRRGFFGSFFFGDDSSSSVTSEQKDYGWGGRTSCAYVLQYVRRWDIERLYRS